MRHPSFLSVSHQGTQRAAAEFARLNASGNRAAMGGDVRPSRVIPFRCFSPHPGCALQPSNGAPLAWLAPLLGWARRGERRHAWVCVAGAVVLFGIVVGA